MTKPLKGFAKNLENLRKELKRDGENCQELQDAIMEIELASNVKNNDNILTKLSIFIRCLRRWEETGCEDSSEEKVESLRLKFRDDIEKFEQKLREAVENRCYPD